MSLQFKGAIGALCANPFGVNGPELIAHFFAAIVRQFIFD